MMKRYVRATCRWCGVVPLAMLVALGGVLARAEVKPAPSPAPGQMVKPKIKVPENAQPPISKPGKATKEFNYAMSTRDPAPLVKTIDRLWLSAIESARIVPAPIAEDAEFLRRACLDLTGSIPTYERTIAFLTDTSEDKRARLIDALLTSREFGLNYGERWRNLLAPRDYGSTKESVDRVTPWLAEQFNANRPWSEIARGLLTAEGSLTHDPQSVLFATHSEEFNPRPNLLAGATGRLFLGVQVACAECHNHPFAEWTQVDFWGLAAFYSQVRKRSKSDFSLIDEPAEIAAIVIPDGAGKGAGSRITARFLGTEQALTSDGESPRRQLANWITARDNRWFARALVNRLWAQLFGRGLVHPVDDFREGNPASHPELLEALADEFLASGHDIKHLLRCLARSQAYQRASHGGELQPAGTVPRFERMAVKVMTPEMLYDSLTIVLNARPAAQPVGGKPPASKGKSVMLESREAFVRFFGRGTSAEDSEQFRYGIPQQLRWMNGKSTGGGASFIAPLMAQGIEPAAMIETLYLVVLSRHPTTDESQSMQEYVRETDNVEPGYAGVLWMLLNSSEFVLNH